VCHDPIYFPDCAAGMPLPSSVLKHNAKELWIGEDERANSIHGRYKYYPL
jgi:hypothetical protein